MLLDKRKDRELCAKVRSNMEECRYVSPQYVGAESPTKERSDSTTAFHNTIWARVRRAPIYIVSVEVTSKDYLFGIELVEKFEPVFLRNKGRIGGSITRYKKDGFSINESLDGTNLQGPVAVENPIDLFIFEAVAN